MSPHYILVIYIYSLVFSLGMHSLSKLIFDVASYFDEIYINIFIEKIYQKEKSPIYID